MGMKALAVKARLIFNFAYHLVVNSLNYIFYLLIRQHTYTSGVAQRRAVSFATLGIEACSTFYQDVRQL